MKLNPIILLAFVLVLAIGIMPSTYALIPLTDCDYLMQEGETYVLQNDIYVQGENNPVINDSGYCFEFQVNNIIFDGNGYSIIENSTVLPYSFEAFGVQVANSTIQNVTVSDGWNKNINLQGQGGVHYWKNVNFNGDTSWIFLNQPNEQLIIQDSTLTGRDSSSFPVILTALFGDSNKLIINNSVLDSNYGGEPTIDSSTNAPAQQIIITNSELINRDVEAFKWTGNLQFQQLTITDTIINENAHDTDIDVVSTTFSGNTWITPSETGHSNTCTDNGGVCLEPYEVISTPTAFNETTVVYVGVTACTPNWICLPYNPAPTCLINDTYEAECVGAFDLNSCGETYSGDYSEFGTQSGVCDYCTPNAICLPYDTPVCLQNDTSTAQCLGVLDFNGCYALTNLTSDLVETDDFANQTGVCDYCTPNWVCDGYGNDTCLIDDTTTASCNSVNDLNACGEAYTGDYTEFANSTGVCDYCTPSWSCDNYINSSCVIENGTGSLYQTCNSVEDSNGCFPLTALPSDNYVGDYSEYGITPLECSANQTQKTEYAFGVIIALLPLIFICGSCIVYIGLNYGRKGNKHTNNAVKITGAVTGLIIVLLLLALL